MIHKLADMIGSPQVQAMISRDMGNNCAQAVWVRAVPRPFRSGFFARLADAWAVLTERAYAVKWPTPGEFEQACQAAEASAKPPLPQGAQPKAKPREKQDTPSPRSEGGEG